MNIKDPEFQPEWAKAKAEQPVSKFKVGDRVAVYGQVRPQLGYFYRGEKGAIQTLNGDHEITVKFDNHETITVHPKQCRKLVKKERRRVWVAVEFLGLNHKRNIGGPTCVVTGHKPNWGTGWTEFIEVKKK